MPVSWKTLFLPKNFPIDQVFSNYILDDNETHTGLVLDYGSLFNHHESANAKAEEQEEVPGSSNFHVQVRMGFQYAKACTHNTYTTNTQNTSKVTKDIAAGQEFFFRYGEAQLLEFWFGKLRTDIDYANTMWRPGLHPLPCRQSVRHTTGADGRDSFAVMADTIPSGTVVDISLCVEVSLNVVDQFPVLWDFVLIDATTQTVCTREVC